MSTQNNLQVTLLLMRISIFVVMFMWTLDKFVNPGHAAAVFANFYHIGGIPHFGMTIIGALEMLLLGCFVTGLYKKYSYGAVALLHGISTVASYKQYMAPFDGSNLLFFAAIPMLAACIGLFLLRDQDRKLVL